MVQSCVVYGRVVRKGVAGARIRPPDIRRTIDDDPVRCAAAATDAAGVRSALHATTVLTTVTTVPQSTINQYIIHREYAST